MAKRLSDKQKKEIIESFTLGDSINELSKKYNFTMLTISRNLKKYLGENKFKELSQKTKSVKESNLINHEKNEADHVTKLAKDNPLYNLSNERDIFESNKDELVDVLTQFTEIAPLNIEFDCSNQQDLSSVPISKAELPKVAYLIVDKQIELEIKLLKDYPQWQFFEQELKRKTIQIFYDLKVAKRFCNNEKGNQCPTQKFLKLLLLFCCRYIKNSK